MVFKEYLHFGSHSLFGESAIGHIDSFDLIGMIAIFQQSHQAHPGRRIKSLDVMIERPTRQHLFMMIESNTSTYERRQKNRRDKVRATIARRALELRRGLGRAATKSFLLRNGLSPLLVNAILAIPTERRVRRRRKEVY